MEPRKQSPISFRRLERKVDQLSEDVQQDKRATAELTRQVNLLNPNGKATAILALADASGPLLELARVAPRLVEAAERDADMAAFWRVLGRLKNPLKPAGALAWTVIGTIVAALLWNFLTRH